MITETLGHETIMKVLIGLIFLYAGHVCSSAAANAYNAYFCGESHDLSASVWQIIGVAAYLFGGFLLFITLATAVPTKGVTITVKNMSVQRREDIPHLFWDKVTGKLYDMTDDLDLSMPVTTNKNGYEKDLSNTLQW